MKKYVLFIVFYSQYITFSYSQNIGVGNSNPQEKLDVSGNINVTGTIKTNGVDGTAGQVLMKNSSNLLSWATLCDFKSMATFIDTSVLSSQWNIPAGVTKIRIEMWGGGGAGMLAGGGGGGYLSIFRNVLPGNNLVITVGKGGKDLPSSGFNQSGGASSVVSASAGINAYAFGGTGAFTSTGAYNQDLPGTGGVIIPAGGGGGHDGFYGQGGQAGSPLRTEYFLLPSNQYNRVDNYGNGGNAANTQNTAGIGGVLTRNINGAVTTNLALSPARSSGFPGGGGGGSADGFINTNRAGSNGMVIIHY